MHAKHALDESGNDQLVVIRSPSCDTDVIVMTTVHHPTKRLIVDNGNGESRRMIVCDKNIDNEQRSVVVGFHSFTGCDYTSSFFHNGKITSWEKTCVKPKFLAALSILGNQVTLDDETFSTLEEYTCFLYGSNSKNINKLRFQKFIQKYEREERYVDLALLPPCRNSLLLHTQRANRPAYLMKRANIAIVQEPALQDCVWDVTGNIIWATEHFPEKNIQVIYNECQDSDDVIDDEDFDESEFEWEGASNDSDTE